MYQRSVYMYMYMCVIVEPLSERGHTSQGLNCVYTI